MTDDFGQLGGAGADVQVPSDGAAEKPNAPVAAGGGETIRYSAPQVKAARSMLTRLSALRRAARFYPMDHPAVADAVARFGDTVHVYHDEGVDVQLAFFEDEILLGSQLLAEESMTFDELGRDMRELGIGSMVLRVGLSGNELLRASRILAADVGEAQAAGGAAQMAAEENLPHVQFASVQMVAAPPEEFDSGEPVESPRGAMGNAIALLREVDLLRQNNRLVSAGHINGVVRSLVDNVLADRYTMLQLTALRNYDEYTFFHSANVAVVALALGASVSEDHRFLSSLGVGALLHDIGKLTIETALLNKPGTLTPDEWARMRQHPISGAQMIAQLPGLDKSAVVSILEHHMRWDGTGYPSRTPRRKQHLNSRIVAIADAYDAMTSRRSYSAARVEDDAMLNIVQGSGTAFDPELVRLFVSMMGIYPPRSVVRLSTGAVAIVLAANPADAARPVIRLIAAPDGQLVPPEDVVLQDSPELGVTACLDPQLLNIDVDDYL
jgi:HD-GYP domain-containing protein (c-di-GMP phosphodiesterase class II)